MEQYCSLHQTFLIGQHPLTQNAKKMFKKSALIARYACSIAIAASIFPIACRPAAEHQHISPLQPIGTGTAPGMKFKLLSDSGNVQSYVLIFSKGDEVVSGINEFARQHNIKSAHYTAIGDGLSAKIGFFDYGRKMFKVIDYPDPLEVASLIGDIAVYNNKPVSHTHVTISKSDGTAHGGHLLELITGPTLELFMTVEPTPLYKQLNREFDAGIITPELTE